MRERESTLAYENRERERGTHRNATHRTNAHVYYTQLQTRKTSKFTEAEAAGGTEISISVLPYFCRPIKTGAGEAEKQKLCRQKSEIPSL